MPRTYPPAATLTFTLLKLVAIAVGFLCCMLSLMSMVGAVSDSLWVRGIAALVMALAPPLFLADRLLPDSNEQPAPGLVTDVFSSLWLGAAMLWSLALHGVSGAMLAREGDRLAADGFDQLASVAYLLAGVEITPAGAAPSPVGSASASSSASAAAAPASAAPAASASSSASGDADAGAPPPAPAPTAAAPGEKSPAELFKLLAPSVVTIFVKGGQGEEASGTGFLVDSKGTIATNHHVINHPGSVQIKFMNGARFDGADVLVESETIDLALLAIDLAHPADAGPRAEIKPLPLGDSDKVVVGERAISIGNPLGLEHTLTDGLVSARRLYEGRAWIQMSVPVSPGNSGGPLFNMRGEVIGITTRQVLGGGFGNRAQNLNLAVPVNELKKMIAPSYPSRRKFGERRTQGQW